MCMRGKDLQLGFRTDPVECERGSATRALLKEPKGNKQDDMRGILREKMALSEWE